jgi:hypothetical protein
MKTMIRILSAMVIIATITGCYSRKERIVERERPVVRERVIETPSTTIQEGDTTIKVK